MYTQEIDADYTLVHASGFLEDNSGQIILSTEYQVPILFKRHTIRLKTAVISMRLSVRGNLAHPTIKSLKKVNMEKR